MSRVKQVVDGRDKPGHDSAGIGETKGMAAIYIDADACPVKQEIYRVAERHACKGVFSRHHRA
jgi:hypothetical protein